MIMRALILAEEKQEEIEKPKALVKVAGISLIYRALKALKNAKIKKAYVVVGYNAYKIYKEIGNYHEGIEINYIKNEGWRKGSLYSLTKAKNLIKENFLLLSLDYIFDSRIINELANYKDKKALIYAFGKPHTLFLCSPKIFIMQKRG